MSLLTDASSPEIGWRCVIEFFDPDYHEPCPALCQGVPLGLHDHGVAKWTNPAGNHPLADLRLPG